MNSFFCAHRLTWQVVAVVVVAAAIFKTGKNYFSSQLQRVRSVVIWFRALWWYVVEEVLLGGQGAEKAAIVSSVLMLK